MAVAWKHVVDGGTLTFPYLKMKAIFQAVSEQGFLQEPFLPQWSSERPE